MAFRLPNCVSAQAWRRWTQLPMLATYLDSLDYRDQARTYH
jgi:hypothetical protein